MCGELSPVTFKHDVVDRLLQQRHAAWAHPLESFGSSRVFSGMLQDTLLQCAPPEGVRPAPRPKTWVDLKLRAAASILMQGKPHGAHDESCAKTPAEDHRVEDFAE
jgi:hypothetical protein